MEPSVVVVGVLSGVLRAIWRVGLLSWESSSDKQKTPFDISIFVEGGMRLNPWSTPLHCDAHVGTLAGLRS